MRGLNFRYFKPFGTRRVISKLLNVESFEILRSFDFRSFKSRASRFSKFRNSRERFMSLEMYLNSSNFCPRFARIEFVSSVSTRGDFGKFLDLFPWSGSRNIEQKFHHATACPSHAIHYYYHFFPTEGKTWAGDDSQEYLFLRQTFTPP